jgi:hypothetical protein
LLQAWRKKGWGIEKIFGKLVTSAEDRTFFGCDCIIEFVTGKGCGLKLNDRAGFTESELECLPRHLAIQQSDETMLKWRWNRRVEKAVRKAREVKESKRGK